MRWRIDEMMGRSRVRQQPFGDAGGDGELQPDKMPSKKVLLVLFFAWPVLLCCVINLVWLHLSATSHSPRVVNTIDPGDDDFMRQRARDAASLRNGDGASVPTYAPTTATYSPTAQNQTWAPTSGLSTVRPTSGGQARGLHAPRRTVPGLRKIEERASPHDDERGERSMAHPLAHPRVACFDSPGANNPSEKGGSCNSRGSYFEGAIRLGGDNPRKQEHPLPSIPQAKFKAKGSKGRKGGSNEDGEKENDDDEVGETETCKYAQHPTCDAKAVAPSTCNEIHAMGFDPRMFGENSRTNVKYIVMGGAKCIWEVTTWNGNEEETFILKSHKDSRFLKRQFWEANQRDALIAGGAGNAQLSQAIGSLDGASAGPDWNHILPMYQYCGLANMVPFADGTLTEYVSNYEEEHGQQRLSPSDTFNLALQAARGLHQAQLYWQGKPTFVHADMNPSQFLVFNPNSVDGDNVKSRLPILQINDFNQGRFLTRNETGHVCPYKTCSKNLRGNRYHHPERFIGCVDENDRVDVYSLGSVLFFLLSGGKDPFWDARSYFRPIKAGELPTFPGDLDLTDPAYVELRSVMSKCMAFKPEDRPSSLEVVRMLEEAEKKWGQTKSLPRAPSKEEKQQVEQS